MITSLNINVGFTENRHALPENYNDLSG
jgi:hypothetical protein